MPTLLEEIEGAMSSLMWKYTKPEYKRRLREIYNAWPRVPVESRKWAIELCRTIGDTPRGAYGGVFKKLSDRHGAMDRVMPDEAFEEADPWNSSCFGRTNDT